MNLVGLAYNPEHAKELADIIKVTVVGNRARILARKIRLDHWM